MPGVGQKRTLVGSADPGSGGLVALPWGGHPIPIQEIKGKYRMGDSLACWVQLPENSPASRRGKGIASYPPKPRLAFNINGETDG